MARPSDQPLAADEGDVGSEVAPEDEPDEVKSEKDIAVANNKASYKAISLAMLIITASFIFVGIALHRTLMRVRKAAMVDAAPPAQAGNTPTSEGALRELQQSCNTNPTAFAARARPNDVAACLLSNLHLDQRDR